MIAVLCVLGTILGVLPAKLKWITLNLPLKDRTNVKYNERVAPYVLGPPTKPNLTASFHETITLLCWWNCPTFPWRNTLYLSKLSSTPITIDTEMQIKPNPRCVHTKTPKQHNLAPPCPPYSSWLTAPRLSCSPTPRTQISHYGSSSSSSPKHDGWEEFVALCLKGRGINTPKATFETKTKSHKNVRTTIYSEVNGSEPISQL